MKDMFWCDIHRDPAYQCFFGVNYASFRLSETWSQFLTKTLHKTL